MPVKDNAIKLQNLLLKLQVCIETFNVYITTVSIEPFLELHKV